LPFLGGHGGRGDSIAVVISNKGEDVIVLPSLQDPDVIKQK
jgi:hypothetical protein